jgi:sugar (pentulose or hexulose) kinase
MLLLGIDIGTTNSKAGLFTLSGNSVAIASRPTLTYNTKDGMAYHDPETFWQTIANVIKEVSQYAEGKPIVSIGIASMAESGLLVDRSTGKPKSVIMPWFDPCSVPQAEQIRQESDPFERFQASGLHGSFKLGLAKLLWLKEHQPESLKDAYWLSTSSYIAYQLTGKFNFDYSLAARTYAFRIDTKTWDREWIRHFGLDESMFPDAVPAGTIIGQTISGQNLGIQEGIPVAIAGHDHVCASLSVGAIVPGRVYDSMGTAETLVGTLPERTLTRSDFEAGLSFGCHIAPNRYFWMGGNSQSGGSVEWLRKLLADEALSYENILSLLSGCSLAPTGILYFPYLAGSGAPQPDSNVRAAFIGLTKQHGKAQLIKSVLEGTAYQLESIRKAAETITSSSIEQLSVVGGGTRNPYWLQIKADVSGCQLDMFPIKEATLLGASLAAAVGVGIYGSSEEASSIFSDNSQRHVIFPTQANHALYRRLYEQGYNVLQKPLRDFSHLVKREGE